MQSFKALLPKALKNLGLDKRYGVENINFHWRKIVGENIAEHAQPGKLQRGVLTVAAKNSVWAYHLLTLKENIITKINAFAGQRLVSDIKFQAGYFKIDPNEEDTNIEHVEKINLNDIILSEQEVTRINSMTNGIDDKEVQAKLKRLLRFETAMRKVRQTRNWAKCRNCGVLCPPGTDICTVCSVEARQQTLVEIRKLLRQAPWLSFSDCKPYIECQEYQYKTAKNALIDGLRQELKTDSSDQLKLMTLVMLQYGAKPDEITDSMLTGTLDKIRGKKYVFASRV